MRIFLLSIFVVATIVIASAEVSETELATDYLPPNEAGSDVKADEETAQDTATLGDDGYQYKTVKRLRYRHRREANDVAPEYLPPTEETPVMEADEETAQDTTLGAAGYQYKTVKRLRYRHRRETTDVAPEYLPPTEETPVVKAVDETTQDTATLGADGYQYKTVKRLRYRHRREATDVAPEYLPPTEETPAVKADDETALDTATLGDDGYQYKTVKKLRYRHRRETNDVAPEYLPPTEETPAVEADEETAQDTTLGADGYQYKTVTRLRYRHRREVTDAAPEYLPPTEETPAVKSDEETAQDTATLGEDGYAYKTVKRLRYRHRREVTDVAPEYLPPTEETHAVKDDQETAQDTATLGEDGYQYKTLKRLRYRHRRETNDVAPEYLPPTEETPAMKVDEETAQDTATLGEDGYAYKTVKRLRYRHRREATDVAPEYLPPTEETPILKADEEPAQDTATLGEDGYQYKTVKRLRYRHRREVTAVAPEYLPATEETPAVKGDEETAQDTATLGENGYGYKTVKRLRYRHRREATDVAPDYLPPTEETIAVKADEETAQDTDTLGEHGYQYKTVKRQRYRHRRETTDVASEYLPPTEETPTVKADDETAQDTATLGEDGYQYKTVKRLRYRHRRETNDVAPEYLPPTEETPAMKVDEETAQDTATLGEDGYQYKTVKRLRYRYRRAATTQEYLPTIEDTLQTEAVDAPQDTAQLNDNGYQYKTVRRLKLRHRRDVAQIPDTHLPPLSTEAVLEVTTTQPSNIPTNAEARGYHYEKPAKIFDMEEMLEENADDTVVVEAPMESGVLTKDGYHYRAIKRNRY